MKTLSSHIVSHESICVCRKWIGSDFESVSGSLVVLDKNKDGYVTVTDLLSLLHRNGFQLTETQLTCLLNL